AEAVDTVARGEISVSLMSIGSGSGAIVQGAPIEIVFPAEGMAIYDYYIGLASSVKNTAAAELFLNWTMSKRGQEVLATFGDYPVRTDVSAPKAGNVELPSANDINLFRFLPEDALENTQSDA